MEIILPIIHMNGTSKESLMNDLETAFFAINNALDAMRQIAPNGRDYYPQPGLMDKAIEQHTRRCLALSSLLSELETEVNLLNQKYPDRN